MFLMILEKNLKLLIKMGKNLLKLLLRVLRMRRMVLLR